MGNKMRISENVPAEILPTSVPLGILWAVILLVAGGLLVVLMSVPLTPPSDPKPHTFVDAFFFLFRPFCGITRGTIACKNEIAKWYIAWVLVRGIECEIICQLEITYR
jgi:hypothetical protein